MTETATREDLEIFLKDSPGCQTKYQPCTEPVAWLCIHPCCGHRTMLCDTHKSRHERAVADKSQMATTVFPQLGGMLRCAFCRELSKSPTYLPI